MSRADSGGFDLVLELATPAIEELLRDHLPTRVDREWEHSIDLMGMTLWHLDMEIHMGFLGVKIAPAPSGGGVVVSNTFSTAGTRMCTGSLLSDLLSRVIDQDILDSLLGLSGGCHEFSPAVSWSGTLTGDGGALRLEDMRVTVDLPPGTLEVVPGVVAYLALCELVPGGRNADEAREALYADVKQTAEAVINALLLDSVTLMALPIASITPAAVGSELRLLMNVDSSGTSLSDPAAITRSAVGRRPGATASQRDLAALVVANDWLLRSAVRPALKVAFGLHDWLDPHPCASVQQRPLFNWMGMSVESGLTYAEVNSSGDGRVVMGFRARHSTGAFGITGTLSIGFGVTLADGQLVVKVATPTVRNVDLVIEGWVYAVAVFFPADPLVLLAMGIADACAGGDAVAAISGAVSGKLVIQPIDIPLPVLGSVKPQLAIGQPDAEWQIANLPVGTVTAPLPLSRANDAIAWLYRQS